MSDRICPQTERLSDRNFLFGGITQIPESWNILGINGLNEMGYPINAGQIERDSAPLCGALSRLKLEPRNGSNERLEN